MDTTKTPRSLNRQHILDEDEYTEALSAIIARDYFPSLVSMHATNEYLDASATGDPALIAASVRKLQSLDTPSARRPWQTPSQTPYGGGPTDTPRSVRGQDEERPSKRPRYNKDLSLDGFQAKYTSEDNSSFTQILHEENRQRKEKWSWAWEAQQRVEAQRNHMLEGREKMLELEGPTNIPGVREKLLVEPPMSTKMITDGEAGSDEKQVTLVEEEEEEPMDVMAPTKDTRTTVVDAWKFKARNALMFPPDADISPYSSTNQVGSYLVDTRGEPKAITHSSTRLPEQDNPSSRRGATAPPSPTHSRVAAAISGTKYRPTEEFPLVPTMPSPTPSELGPDAVKQLMTWGTLSSTPRVISTSGDPVDIINSHLAVNINDSKLADSSRSAFHLPVPSSREVISRRLGDKASKSLRTKAGLLGLGLTPNATSRASMTPSGTPTAGRTALGRMAGKGSMAPPSWTTPRTPRADAAGSLTPAARRLLDRSTIGTLRANARGHGHLTPHSAARRVEAVRHQDGWERELAKIRWEPNSTRRRDTDEFEAFDG